MCFQKVCFQQLSYQLFPYLNQRLDFPCYNPYYGNYQNGEQNFGQKNILKLRKTQNGRHDKDDIESVDESSWTLDGGGRAQPTRLVGETLSWAWLLNYLINALYNKHILIDPPQSRFIIDKICLPVTVVFICQRLYLIN